jgi:hypothetical protein
MSTKMSLYLENTPCIAHIVHIALTFAQNRLYCTCMMDMTEKRIEHGKSQNLKKSMRFAKEKRG